MLARVIAIAFVLLALGAPAVARAAQADNLQTFRAVQREVLRYPHFTIFDSVNMQVDEGVVVLTGKVTMPYKRNDIVKRVSRVAGIQKVEDRIEVLPVSKFDDDLRVAIARAIYSNPAFSAYRTMVNPPIHVIVERGRVTLEGVVANNIDRQLAYNIAAGFQAFAVKNLLRTEEEVKKELEKL